MRTSLSRAAGRSPTSPAELDAMARRAWQERGIAFIDPAAVADAWEAQVVTNVANRLYGPRKEDKPNV